MTENVERLMMNNLNSWNKVRLLKLSLLANVF